MGEMQINEKPEFGADPETADGGISGLKRFFKKFSFSTMALILLAVTTYKDWPIELKVPTASELHEIVGMPAYVETSGRHSGYSFRVNDMALSCELKSTGGPTDCWLFSNAIKALDMNKPARAIYSWQPTRLGYHYRTLYSLEQDGKMIISPEQLRAQLLKSYKIEWEVFHITEGLMIFIACIFLFIELFVRKIAR
jgi:hypothetical protein